MSIDAKHAYRFGYLKSEHWENVRLEALAREKGACQICSVASLSNDAHHIWYPENIYETKEHHLVVLCRACHEFVHNILPECKTGDEETGRLVWIKFRNAIIAWRLAKSGVFDHKYTPSTPQHVKGLLISLKQQCVSLGLPNRALSEREKKRKDVIGRGFKQLEQILDGMCFFRNQKSE